MSWSNQRPPPQENYNSHPKAKFSSLNVKDFHWKSACWHRERVWEIPVVKLIRIQAPQSYSKGERGRKVSPYESVSKVEDNSPDIQAHNSAILFLKPGLKAQEESHLGQDELWRRHGKIGPKGHHLSKPEAAAALHRERRNRLFAQAKEPSLDHSSLCDRSLLSGILSQEKVRVSSQVHQTPNELHADQHGANPSKWVSPHLLSSRKLAAGNQDQEKDGLFKAESELDEWQAKGLSVQWWVEEGEFWESVSTKFVLMY